jgi:hypothetical protein
MIRARFRPFRFAMLPIAPARPREAIAPRQITAVDAVHAYKVLGVPSAMALQFGTFHREADSDREGARRAAAGTNGAATRSCNSADAQLPIGSTGRNSNRNGYSSS